MDHVPVIDDMPVFAVRVRAAAAQRHQWRRTEKAFEPVVIEMHPQAMADQARGDRIEHFFQGEAAARGDGDERLLVVGGAAGRQLLHGRALEIEQFAVARIAPPDDLIDKATVGLERVKGARAAQ